MNDNSTRLERVFSWLSDLLSTPDPTERNLTVTFSFNGRAKRLDAWDFGAIARSIGVGEDEVRAVVEVETRGGGFDNLGRPKMLFEPHVFYREVPVILRARALERGLAYSRWGTKPYPADSYPHLQQAILLDREAALRSASWGAGQIMGFNCRAAGYSSASMMVSAFLDDEEAHLQAMVEFIASEHLDDDLRRHDWSGFARGYNGAGYAKNGYHTKLAAAFSKWSKIKDTPVPKAS